MPIRFHRACSWLQRAETNEDDNDPDSVLVNRWIAFNAMYGQWDENRREPKSDRDCWRLFMDRLLAIDETGHLQGVLEEYRPLVLKILDDEYLSRYFWEQPTAQQARKAKKARFDAPTWYYEKRWSLIVDRLLERIYLLRCQLVHGAATHGSRLNRTALRNCATMMHYLVTAALRTLIDHGADEDWGPMCYPPLE